MGIFNFLTGSKSKTQTQQEQQTLQKETQDTTTTAAKTSTQNQTAAGTTQQAGTSSSTTGQISTQAQEFIDSLLGSSSGTQKLLSDQSLGLVQGLVGSTGADVGSADDLFSSILNQRLTDIGEFDADAFVRNSLAGVQQQFEDDVLPQLAVFGGNVGGSAATNSASALLTARALSENTARLAGVEAQSTQIANAIANENLVAGAAGADRDLINFLNLIGAERGAFAETTQAQQQTSERTGTTTGSVTGSANTQQQQSGTTTETAKSEFEEFLDQIVSAVATLDSRQTASGISTTKNSEGLKGLLSNISALLALEPA